MTLCIENISKKYGKVQALKDVHLEIEPGAYGLLGPNGAGKSTLMKILATILKPDAGTIRLDELQWQHQQDVRKILGYLPQKFDFFPHLTVQESLEYIAYMKGIKREDISEQVERVLRLTDMEDYKKRKNKTLSGGMLRRFGIAQAILGMPRLLIVDEPTAGLDPSERMQFRSIIGKIASEDTIVLISTHIVQDIEVLCEQVAILCKGAVLRTGSPAQIAASAKGHIVERTVDAQERKRIAQKYRVISQTASGDDCSMRYITQEKEEVFAAPPTLEEAYLYLTGK